MVLGFLDRSKRLHGHLIERDKNGAGYPLHLKVRNNILSDIFEGKLVPADLPARWNADIAHAIRLDIRNDTEGCLQDIHWYSMQFGYFMNYLTGFTMAYQLFDAMKAERPYAMDNIAQSSDFSDVTEWLEDKIFRWGAKHNTMTLLERITGKPFSADSYIESMEEKYFPIYA